MIWWFWLTIFTWIVLLNFELIWNILFDNLWFFPFANLSWLYMWKTYLNDWDDMFIFDTLFWDFLLLSDLDDFMSCTFA